MYVFLKKKGFDSNLAKLIIRLRTKGIRNICQNMVLIIKDYKTSMNNCVDQLFETKMLRTYAIKDFPKIIKMSYLLLCLNNTVFKQQRS